MERAFILSHDCSLYKAHMGWQKEKKKFLELAQAFSDKYDLGKTWHMDKRLCVELSIERAKELKSSLIKEMTNDGLRRFRANSELNKKWKEEVWSHIDTKSELLAWGWAHGCIGKGSKALWDWKGEVYGLLCSTGEILLPPGATEIKMSEYYKLVEEIEG